MEINPGGLPDLSRLNKPSRATTGFGGIVRRLSPDGTYEPDQVIDTGNGYAAIPHRTDVVDAEELCEMFRRVLREENALLVERLRHLLHPGE